LEDIFNKTNSPFPPGTRLAAYLRDSGSVSGLGAPLRQLELWGAQGEKSRKLQEALDELQEKFGKKVIRRGKR